jgi:CRP/FNR family cyclic AMP-dependent transcriptional regulator
MKETDANRVEEGLLKASVAALNGGERILAILGPGSVVGELSMIDGAPRSTSGSAASGFPARSFK